MPRKVTPQEYAELMGREPPVDESDGAWQWDYRGTTKEERDELARKMGLEPDPEPDEQIHQDESLF